MPSLDRNAFNRGITDILTLRPLAVAFARLIGCKHPAANIEIQNGKVVCTACRRRL